MRALSLRPSDPQAASSTAGAIQTVLFYLEQCRDPPTAQWLERFCNLRGISRYHGTEGLSRPWRHVVDELLHEPPTTIVVESIARNRAGSKDNPFMPPKVLTMELDVVPRRLALRILDCARDVAAECGSDLGRMGQENAALMRILEDAAGQGIDRDKLTTYPTLAHEPEGTDKSAFRGGNYDLLLRLATKQALRESLASAAFADRRWLARFYRAHGAGFIGDSRYKVAETFLSAMLAAVPSVTSDGALIDPVALAVDIMARRASVAEFWAGELEDFGREVEQVKMAATIQN